MMRKKHLFILTFLASGIAYGQVGVNTEDPKSTLHIKPTKEDATTAEGIIAPNLTRAQLITKDAKYTTAQKGSIVYVTDLSGTLTTKTAKVTQIGYYYFDGEVWQQFATSAAGNIPTEPWRVQGGVKEATTNAENIYQQGKVAIGIAQTGVALDQTLYVNGATKVTGNIAVDKQSHLAGKVGIGRPPASDNFALAVAGNTHQDGALTVTGNETVGGTLAVTGNTTIGKAAVGTTPASGDLTVHNKVGIGRTPAFGDYALAVKGNTHHEGGIHVHKGALQVDETGSFILKGNGVGAGKYLMSNVDGKGTWTTLPATATTEPWATMVNGAEQPATSYVQNITRGGAVTIGNAALETGRNFQVNGNSYTTGNSKVGSSTVVGDETVGGTLAVTGNTTIGKAAAGTTLASGNLTVYNKVGIGREVDNANINSYTLAIKGSTYQDGALTVTGNESVGGTLAVTGNTTIGKAGVAGTSAGSGLLRVHGAQIIGTNKVQYTGTSYITEIHGEGQSGGLWVEKLARFRDKLIIGNDLKTTDDALTIENGKFVLKGNGAGAGKYLMSDASGKGTWTTLPATATTEPWATMVNGAEQPATSYVQNITRGGAVTIGNAALETGRNFQVNGNSYTTGNSKVGSSTVDGNETVGGTLAVTGNTTIGKAAAGTTPASGNLTVYNKVGIGAAVNAASGFQLQVTGASNTTGNSTVGSSTVTGNENVGGTLAVTKTTTLTGNVGIGVAPNAAQKLNIASTGTAANPVAAVKIVDGSQAANRVLTSDASGVASWKPIGGGDGNQGEVLVSDGQGGSSWQTPGFSEFTVIPGKSNNMADPKDVSYRLPGNDTHAYTTFSFTLKSKGTYLITLGLFMRILSDTPNVVAMNDMSRSAVQLKPTNVPTDWSNATLKFRGAYEVYPIVSYNPNNGKQIDLRYYINQSITSSHDNQTVYLMWWGGSTKELAGAGVQIAVGETGAQTNGGSYVRIN